MMKILKGLLSLLAVPFVILSAPLYYFMAKTGIGIDFCRRFRFHPVLIHFYHPVPEYETVPVGHFKQKQDLPGINMDMPVVRSFLQSLGQFSRECDWPQKKTSENSYYWDNPTFSYSSACILHTMIRANRSRKLIEIGGGFSSLITLEALNLNCPGGGHSLHCVEPYPSPWLKELAVHQSPNFLLYLHKVQELSPDFLTDLGENDILFIDSSHVTKLNSDVNFIFLQILPRLKKGVIVHVHDIYLPYEYPREHFSGETKIFWNEQYLLQAFLIGNKDFKVILPGYYFQTDFPDDFKKAFSGYDSLRHRATSSFWMQKIS